MCCLGVGHSNHLVVYLLLNRVDTAAQFFCFSTEVDLPDTLQDKGDQDRNQHTHGIGDRIAHRGQVHIGRRRFANGFDDRRKRGCVGQSAGEQAGGHRRVELQQVGGDNSDQGSDQQDDESRQVVAQSLALERCEEARPAGQPDRVDEQDQAQLEDDGRQLHIGIQGAHRQTDEKDRRDAKTGALDLDAANGIADGRHAKKQQQRVFYDEFDHGVSASELRDCGIAELRLNWLSGC